MRAETFSLVYASEGAFTWGDVQEMSADERRWYLERLSKQKQMEQKKIAEMRAKYKK